MRYCKKEKRNMAKVGIVILNYNTYDDTKKCIESIKSMTETEYTIYLVDNASKEECRKKLSEKYKDDDNVKMLFSDHNLGYSGGNNIGVQRAIVEDAEYILIVNSDVVFCNDVVKYLMEGLNEEIVLSGPCINCLDGSDGQQLMRVYNFSAALFDRQPFYSLSKYFSCFNYRIKPLNKEMVVSGCCFMASAKVFKNLGLFDDNVFLYSEERILGNKLYNYGYKVMYNPRAKIIHAEGKSTGRANAFADYHRYASDYYCISQYICPRKFEKILLKYIRLLNFKIKSFKSDEYKKRYVMLKNKYKEIDKGNYKITF